MLSKIVMLAEVDGPLLSRKPRHAQAPPTSATFWRVRIDNTGNNAYVYGMNTSDRVEVRMLLPRAIVEQIDRQAREERRSRPAQVAMTLERALRGQCAVKGGGDLADRDPAGA